VAVFAAKLLLAPAFVVAASLAARKWGATIGGVIGGLPVVAGPILLILTIQHGAAFGSRAAAGTLLGLVALTGFVVSYALLCRRSNWLVCVGIGWAVFLLVVAAFDQTDLTAGVSLAIAFVAFTAALRWMPRPRENAAAPVFPSWDLPLRAVAAAVLVIALTAAADALGPRLSGLLAPFPIITTILAAFTHAHAGAEEAIAILRGMERGFYAFALFCFTASAMLGHVAIGVAFAFATIVALVVQGLVILSVAGRPGDI
jgi:hypothetical protein